MKNLLSLPALSKLDSKLSYKSTAYRSILLGFHNILKKTISHYCSLINAYITLHNNVYDFLLEYVEKVSSTPPHRQFLP